MNGTLQSISGILADWATFFAAVTALLALLEMHRQRKHSYKPDIVPTEKSFDCLFNSPISHDWYEWKKGEEHTHKLNISLFNLGNGPAKNIKYKWSFEYFQFIDELNKLNEKAKNGISFSYDKNWIHYKQKPTNQGFTGAKIEGSKDYILSSSIDKEGLQIFIPPSYMLLTSNYYYLKFTLPNQDIRNLKTPELKLEINYSDIAGNKYSKVYCFYVDVSFFMGEDHDTQESSENRPELHASLKYRENI